MTTALASTATDPGPDPTTDAARRAQRALTGAATLAMGLIAGFFYAYACSVMVGLARTDDRTFVATMQSINATIRNAGFAPSFFGALLLAGAAAAVAVHRRSPERAVLVAAALLYAAAFLVTIGISVPLNDELAAAGHVDQIANLAEVRDDYESPWVAWNLVRTALSTAALAALVASLLRADRRHRGRTSVAEG